MANPIKVDGLNPTEIRRAFQRTKTLLDNLSTDHAELTNLNWAAAGHTIDTDVDLDSNNLLNAASIDLINNGWLGHGSSTARIAFAEIAEKGIVSFVDVDYLATANGQMLSLEGDTSKGIEFDDTNDAINFLGLTSIGIDDGTIVNLESDATKGIEFDDTNVAIDFVGLTSVGFPNTTAHVIDFSGASTGCGDMKAEEKVSATTNSTPTAWGGSEFGNYTAGITSGGKYNKVAVDGDALVARTESTVSGQYPQHLYTLTVPQSTADMTELFVYVTCYGAGGFGGGSKGAQVNIWNFTDSQWDAVGTNNGTLAEVSATYTENFERYVNANGIIYLHVYCTVAGGAMFSSSIYTDYVKAEVTAPSRLTETAWANPLQAGGYSLYAGGVPFGDPSNPLGAVYANNIQVGIGTSVAYNPSVALNVIGSTSGELALLWGDLTYTGTDNFRPFFLTGTTSSEYETWVFGNDLLASKTSGTLKYSGNRHGRSTRKLPGGSGRTNLHQVYGAYYYMGIDTTNASSYIYGGRFYGENAQANGSVYGVYGEASGGDLGAYKSWAGYFEGGPTYINDGLKCGSTGAPSSMASFGTGSGWFTDELEVDGRIWCDGRLRITKKTDTGDYGADLVEGDLVLNTFDNNVKIYENGAWRQIAAW